MAGHQAGRSRARALWYGLLCLCCLLLVAGCQQKNETTGLKEGQYYTYYVNSSGTALVSRIYEPEATDTEGIIGELLIQCQTAPEGGDGRRAIPSSVTVSDAPFLEERILNLYFDTTYTTMDKVTELLCKAALAKTMTQLEEVDYICIYVNGEVYRGANSYTNGENNGPDANGGGLVIKAPSSTEKTLWSGSDFLDNTGDDTNKYVQAELVLYFANGEGKALEAEVRQVVYSSTLSQEKVVLNQLILGPETEGLTATLPANLKVQGVSLRDGVCYVDFDATFLEESVNVTDVVEIYSIVNSLTELDNVQQVQITVNGSADAVLRNNIPLSGRFEKDLSLIAVVEESEEETQKPSQESTESAKEETQKPGQESTESVEEETNQEASAQEESTQEENAQGESTQEESAQEETTSEAVVTGL